MANVEYDICLQAPALNKREWSVIKHKPEDIDTWADHLKKQFGGPKNE